MKMKRILKKIAALTLCSALCFGLSSTEGLAATAKGTTLKLVETTGSVSLKDANSIPKSIRTGMRLYNGYDLSTKAASYAYISLDATKAVKMDSNSEITLRQSGKKTEILVESGKLFFDVRVPLKEEETLNIRTSTTVTGVRGTCGVVEHISPTKSKLYLIEGKVTLGSTDLQTGAFSTVTITGGETATIVQGKVSNSESSASEVQVEKLKETDVAAFAAIEIAQDTKLAARIEKENKLNVVFLKNTAASRLIQKEQQELYAEKQAAQNQPKQVVYDMDVTEANAGITVDQVGGPDPLPPVYWYPVTPPVEEPEKPSVKECECLLRECDCIFDYDSDGTPYGCSIETGCSPECACDNCKGGESAGEL